VILCGCSISYLTIYQNNNIEAVGSRKGDSSQAIFYSIDIGNDSTSFNPSINKFAIKLSNGEIITSNKINYKTISELPNIEKTNDKNNNHVILCVDNYRFEFNDKYELVNFYARLNHYSSKKDGAIIGDINLKYFYQFPMSQKELETLFGKPDKYINRPDYW
jgi:hypothetical protein